MEQAKKETAIGREGERERGAALKSGLQQQIKHPVGQSTHKSELKEL